MNTIEISWSPDALEGAVVARARFAGEASGDAALDQQLRLMGFDAKPGQVTVVQGGAGAEFWVGMGPRSRVDRRAVRTATAALVRAAKRATAVSVAFVDDLREALGDDAMVACEVAAGAMSARYRFEAHRSRPSSDGPAQLHIVAPSEVTDAVRRTVCVMRGVLLARDLVNEPGGTLVPEEFARRCRVLEDVGVRVVVHDLAALRELGMGGLLGVNRGSTQPAVFVELHHEPDGASDRPRLALVGKGVTFDSGGINIKKLPSSLITMKTDMGGAAAIVAAMGVIAELGVTTPVSAYLPLTDNMLGGDATRPGDVLRMIDGTTVEVVDTDAEGRLILGDGVGFAAATAPAAIVDVATLTFTSVHVTGPNVAPFVSTHDWLADVLVASAAPTNDRIWRMPRVPELRGLLKSSVADMCNRSEAPAASAFAALFVEHFAKEVPFAHIDMYGVVASDRDLPDTPAGARGWGVEMLVELAERFTGPPA